MASRVMVVDDYEPWRRFCCATLQQGPDLQVIAEASDGLIVVQNAKELQPDLILLDVGLPGIDGIQALLQIRECSPKSKILIVSTHTDAAIIGEALRAGAVGYVSKANANRELMPAVRAVLRGKRLAAQLGV